MRTVFIPGVVLNRHSRISGVGCPTENPRRIDSAMSWFRGVNRINLGSECAGGRSDALTEREVQSVLVRTVDVARGGRADGDSGNERSVRVRVAQQLSRRALRIVEIRIELVSEILSAPEIKMPAGICAVVESSVGDADFPRRRRHAVA